jgi:hypothetical protein
MNRTGDDGRDFFFMRRSKKILRFLAVYQFEEFGIPAIKPTGPRP